MDIHTRLDIGDTAFFMRDNKVRQAQVVSICIRHSLPINQIYVDRTKAELTIEYTLALPKQQSETKRDNYVVLEHLVFSSKADLLSSL